MDREKGTSLNFKEMSVVAKQNEIEYKDVIAFLAYRIVIKNVYSYAEQCLNVNVDPNIETFKLHHSDPDFVAFELNKIHVIEDIAKQVMEMQGQPDSFKMVEGTIAIVKKMQAKLGDTNGH